MTDHPRVDPERVRAWLAARSVARGLPLPVEDRGGFRVDTNSADEVKRWVFPSMGTGLKDLARAIARPGYFLKLCGDADELLSALPPGWRIHPPGYLMQAGGTHGRPALAGGYRFEVATAGGVTKVLVFASTGELAASGYAAQTSEVFIYDRIVTDAGHRRRGLGRFVMATLRLARRDMAVPELLVATEDGRALYAALGWRVLSPYSTASIAAP
ncbi:hypothetical protein B2G71_14475 [Novosphingobium sp. PC22D]|uniref:GNAT family N-acetyltransferase n=1 Tax=Novosphingobium sp. PC22D TaxID=1962403 RepID=UPI000BF156E7|nr:GNAT family N-acetyltransferase [Novosphingobium sp. PC22D]PEQ11982.1 hypothetical protein B2G71_14475 [Novosphingobium sp. PC22D]